MNKLFKNFSILTLFSVILIIGCQENKHKDNTETSEAIDQVVKQNPLLPSVAIGVFVGEEPAYSMKVGNQMIPMTSSKWRIEISINLLNMQQVSDGQTIHYEGDYIIKTEDDFSIVIEGNLRDDKYNQTFVPTIRFNKTKNIWFLEGVMGSEGCSLVRE